MYKKWSIFIVTIVIIMGLLLVACPAPETPPTTPPTKPPPAGPTTLKLSYFMPKGVGLGIALDWFGEEFPKRTDGRYEVEVYPAGTLIEMDSSLDAVRDGVVEMSMTSISSFMKAFPLSAVTQIPTLGYPTTIEGMLAADVNYMKLYEEFPEIQNEFKDFKLLWNYGGAPDYIVSKKKEIHKAEDFKGMRVGGVGLKMLIVEENGGASVQQVPPDSYMNLDKGVTDATFLVNLQWMIYRMWEVADYYYKMDFGSGATPLIMNFDAWNAMSPEDQQICLDTVYDSKLLLDQELCPILLNSEKMTADEGGTVVEPTPEEVVAWQKAAQPTMDKFLADAEATGATSGQAVLDEWIKMHKEFMDTH
jgi:TRAP-type C4-dicarboxylate transport system substrate-binding protein